MSSKIQQSFEVGIYSLADIGSAPITRDTISRDLP